MVKGDIIVSVLLVMVALSICYFGISYITSEQVSKDIVNYNQNYNEAKQQTLRQLNTSNFSLIEKIIIIDFNCKNTDMGTGWARECSKDLAKETIKE